MMGGLAACITPARPTYDEKTDMKTLHIDLQEGFQGHAVSVSVDGAVVYSKSSVTTDLSISRADGFDAQVASDKTRIDVHILPNGPNGFTEVDLTENSYLGVSVEGGKITFQFS